MGLLLLLASLACAANQWHTTKTPHFEVMHEAAFMPPGFMVSLEKIHSRLRMDLSMFSPWMAKEKIKLYLYKDRASYLAGEFRPPQWSDGLALFELKAVALPDRPDRKQLAGTAAHEITHLLFESYWKETKKEAPVWLDEGLAMLEEDDPRQPSGRFLALVYNDQEIIDMERFFEITPTKDLQSDKSADRWYSQAYGITRFLYRGHSKLQFKSLCAHIRDGKTPQQALWLTYRYPTLPKFQLAYQKWLKDPARKVEAEPSREAFARAAAEEPEEGKPRKKFEPKAIKPMQGFRSLKDQ